MRRRAGRHGEWRAGRWAARSTARSAFRAGHAQPTTTTRGRGPSCASAGAPTAKFRSTISASSRIGLTLASHIFDGFHREATSTVRWATGYRRRQREVHQRVRMIRADHAADVLRLGHVGGLEAQRAHDAVARGRRYGGMLLQLAGDVLAEVVGPPVGAVGAPTMVNPGGSISASARTGATAGRTGGWPTPPAAPKRTMRSDHGVAPFSPRSWDFCVSRRSLARHPGAATEIAPASGSSARRSQSSQDVVM